MLYLCSMSIAVNGSFLQQPVMALTDHFLYETLLRCASPEFSLLFIVPEAAGLRHPLHEYGLTGLQPVSAKTVTGKLLWSTFQLPKLLQQQKASLWLSDEPEGNGNGLPRVQVVINVGQAKNEKARLMKVLKKSQAVIALTHWCKQQLITEYGVNEDNIHLIAPGISPVFRPVSWEQKEDIKTSYAGGNEYFLFPALEAGNDAIMHVLKAFSVFKKWQKSKMKLVITGITAAHPALEKLENYRFRADVTFCNPESAQEQAAITAGAYAMVYPLGDDVTGVRLLEAMACDVPVIAADAGALPETGGEAALYAAADDIQATGHHMIQLYKDEMLRNRLIVKGRQLCQGYNWDQAAAALRVVLHNALIVPAK